MFQVHSKVIQLYKYTYVTFEALFHFRILKDIDYGSSCYTVNFCCLLHIYFFKFIYFFKITNLAF